MRSSVVLLLCALFVIVPLSKSYAGTGGGRGAGVYYYTTVEPSTGVNRGYEDGDLRLVEDGKKTIVKFFIGPLGVDRGVSPEALPLSARALNNDGIKIEVLMSCKVCSEDSIQTTNIIYLKTLLTSTEATFSITPRQYLLASPLFEGILFIQLVASNGVIIETIKIPVIVGKK